MLTKADHKVVRDTHVRFDTVVLDALDGFAIATSQGITAEFPLDGRNRRKLYFPEVLHRIGEGDSIGIATGVCADLADHANFRFLVALGPAQNEFLFRREFVLRNDARAKKAKHHSLGRLGKNLAVQIGTDKKDGNFLRDAAASAHNLLWQDSRHNRTASRPI